MPPLELKPNLKFELRERGLKRPLKKGLVLIANRRVFAGTDANNDVVITAPKVPTRFLLMEPCGKEKFYFYFTEQMSGLVVKDGVALSLSELISKQFANKSDGYYRVELDVNDEAKLQWGTLELWFKLTLPLPREFKRKVEWGFEMPFMIASIVSLIVHCLMILYFNTRSVGEGIIERRVEDRLVKLAAPEQMQIPEEVLPPQEQELKQTAGVGKGEGKGKGKGKGGGPGTGEGPAQKGILAVLTAHGKGKGVVQDLLQSGFDEDLAKALGSVGGVQVATAGISGTRGGGGGGGGEGGGPATVGIGDLGTWGPAEGKGLQEAQVHKVKSDITPGPVDVIGKLSRDTIMSKVRTYMGGIRSCYEMELRLNPQLTGKISIRFTIGVDGRVSDVEVINSTMGSTEVENCVVRRIRRWEFPPPEEGEVVVTYPFVFTVVTD